MGWQDAPIVGGESQPKWASAPVVGTETQPQQRSTLQEAGRQVGLTGRAVAEGAVDLASIFANPVGVILNAGLRALGSDYQFPEQSGAFSQSLTDAGVPKPETDREKLVNTIGRRATGAAASIGAGAAIAGAPGVTGQVGQSLASNPVIQGVSAATGPMAGEVARQAGAGPGGQAVADLAGSIAPGIASAVGQSTVRGGFRGGEQGRQRVAENVETFSRAGTTPSVGQATESRAARGTESLLSRVPGGAGPILGKAGNQADDLSATIEKRASQLVRKTSAEQAGRKIENSVRGEGGFVDRFKAQQEKLYDELDSFFPSKKKIEVESTRKALKDLNQDIDGAKNLSQWFKNARIKGIEEAFKKDTASPAIDIDTGNPKSAIQSAKSVKELDGIAERLKVGMSAEPTAEQSALEDLYFSTRSALASGKTSAAEATTDIGSLPYEAVKKLRTLVGREMADAGLASDVPRSKWKALYAALSDDIGKAVDKSPVAKAKWTRANNYTRAGMRRIEAIESVINRNGGPEAIFRAATSGTKEGATTLRGVMQSLDDQGRKMVSGTVLRRLGIAKAGVQGDLGDQFSTESFLTNWNLLSQEAKRTLFDRYGPRFRADMDAVAKVASNLREGSQVFRNPSGTQQATAQVATVAGLVTALMTGQLKEAGIIAGAVGGANLSARLMTNPDFVRWLAQSTKIPAGSFPAAVNSLARTAQKSGDMDLARAAAWLEQQDKQADQKGNREHQNQ